MKKEYGVFKCPKFEVFNGKYFDLNKKDVILNSIKIKEFYEDSPFGEDICFRIELTAEGKFRIIPYSSHNRFLIKYYYLMHGYKISV